ncbi:MAG: rhomboid family intramembrane serine protease [Caldilineales bacterium]
MMNTPHSQPEFSTPPAGQMMRLPLARPRWTYVLLAVNVVVFVAMTLYGASRGLGLSGSQDSRVLLLFGAMQNRLISDGDYYRLLASMFLHIGLIHLLFNTYALYILGQDVERLYGNTRFLLIYFLAGLGGSLASFVLGGANGVSAGASGAIFGVIGASIAYFYQHHRAFGARGQAQLRNLLTMAGINLVLGFTIPGINNLAHLGGLIFGLLLGFILSPRYEATLMDPVLRDKSSLGARLPALLLVLVVQAALLVAGIVRWG